LFTVFVTGVSGDWAVGVLVVPAPALVVALVPPPVPDGLLVAVP
jgi:hypothetical protein